MHCVKIFIILNNNQHWKLQYVNNFFQRFMITFHGIKIVKIMVKKYSEIFPFLFTLLNIEILGKPPFSSYTP